MGGLIDVTLRGSAWWWWEAYVDVLRLTALLQAIELLLLVLELRSMGTGSMVLGLFHWHHLSQEALELT